MKRHLFAIFFLGVLAAQGTLAAVKANAHHVVGPVVSTVDVNHATSHQLGMLKGLGSKKAQAIVQYRQTHGQFKQVSDLTAVKGIGVKTLAKIEKDNPGKLMVNTREKLG